MSADGDPAVASADPSYQRVLVPVVVGAAVALFLGAYGRIHDPTGEATISLFFSGTLNFKAWSTTLALLLAFVQLVSALWLYGRLPIRAGAPAWLGELHRVSGLAALFASLPVAYHCLWALGFESDLSQVRRFSHSLFGCIFYGAFAAKVLAVRWHRLPGWLLPWVGGLTFTMLVLVWLTSSLWFFRNVGFPKI